MQEDGEGAVLSPINSSSCLPDAKVNIRRWRECWRLPRNGTAHLAKVVGPALRRRVWSSPGLVFDDAAL